MVLAPLIGSEISVVRPYLSYLYAVVRFERSVKLRTLPAAPYEYVLIALLRSATATVRDWTSKSLVSQVPFGNVVLTALTAVASRSEGKVVPKSSVGKP